MAWAAFTGVLAASGVRISMDGKGRYLDNIFIERLWRSLKYEQIYIKAYASVPEARRGIDGWWLSFYNTMTNACTRPWVIGPRATCSAHHLLPVDMWATPAR